MKATLPRGNERQSRAQLYKIKFGRRRCRADSVRGTERTAAAADATKQLILYLGGVIGARCPAIAGQVAEP